MNTQSIMRMRDWDVSNVVKGGFGMPGRNPMPGDIYQHFKGNKYQVTAIAYDAVTDEKCVVYQALYGEYKSFVRRFDEFISEVDRDKYPDSAYVYRFSFPGDPMQTELAIEESVAEKTEEVNNSRPEHEMRELKHPEDEGEVDPDLLAFLEAETTREKIEVLERARERVTESLLCAIEASLDISYEDEKLDERIYYVENYLRTRERYEGTRLR